MTTMIQSKRKNKKKGRHPSHRISLCNPLSLPLTTTKTTMTRWPKPRPSEEHSSMKLPHNHAGNSLIHLLILPFLPHSTLTLVLRVHENNSYLPLLRTLSRFHHISPWTQVFPLPTLLDVLGHNPHHAPRRSPHSCRPQPPGNIDKIPITAGRSLERVSIQPRHRDEQEVLLGPTPEEMARRVHIVLHAATAQLEAHLSLCE